MIFLTVGTHEQQFNRVIRALDEYAGSREAPEEVVIQYGYSDYDIKNCAAEKFFDFDTMLSLYSSARIVITHGGPCSIIQSLSHDTIPIVVPRDPAFGEHVDNHQLLFSDFLASQGTILHVRDIGELGGVIDDYDALVRSLNAQRVELPFEKKIDQYCDSLENEIQKMLER